MEITNALTYAQLLNAFSLLFTVIGVSCLLVGLVLQLLLK